jgi:DUF4097 and DUF4098 domain-containing protein YvlB
VRLRVAVVGVVALASAACAVDLRSDEYQVREERTFQPDRGTTPDVHLETFDGSIDVRAWDRPEVRVDVEKIGRTKEAVESIKVRSVAEGSRFEVEAVAPTSGDWVAGLIPNGGQRARIQASVPRRCTLTVHTGDGNIKVEGIDGTISLSTDDGMVRGIALAGDVRIKTGDGSIKLEPVDGRVSVDTGDGAIVLGGRVQGLMARTGDGSISIRLDPGSRPELDWDIETDDGGIALEVPEAFGAEIDASTADGVVRIERTLGLDTGERPGRSVKGRVGAGGRLIRIRSGDGSISLRRP